MPNALLIVDDESLLVTVLTTFLDKEGFTVRTAPNGAVALTFHDEVSARLVLSDLMMPLTTRRFTSPLIGNRSNSASKTESIPGQCVQGCFLVVVVE